MAAVKQCFHSGLTVFVKADAGRSLKCSLKNCYYSKKKKKKKNCYYSNKILKNKCKKFTITSMTISP